MTTSSTELLAPPLPLWVPGDSEIWQPVAQGVSSGVTGNDMPMR